MVSVHLASLTGLFFSLSLNSCETPVSATAQGLESGLVPVPLSPHACFESQSWIHLTPLSSGFSTGRDSEQSVLYYPFIPLNLEASIISHLNYLFPRVKFYLPSSYSLFRSYPTSLMLLLNALLPALNLLLLHPLK